MTIQMTQSAASIAAVSSNATLVNLSKTQAETFNLNASTMKASLQANETMAESDSKAILDAANASLVDAMGAFSGAIGGGIATTVGLTGGLSRVNQATSLEESVSTPAKLRASMEPVNEDANAIPLEEIKPSPKSPGSSKTVEENAAAELTVQNSNHVESEAVDTKKVIAKKENATQLTEEEQAVKDQKLLEAKALRDSGDRWLQTGSTYGKMTSDALSSTGKLASYQYQVDQSNQTKIKDTENAVSSTLNTLASLIGQQLGNLDQSRSAISQMIQGLYVRQG